MATVQIPIRAAGISLALSGVLVVVATPLHPDIFKNPLAESVNETWAWTFIHLAMLASAALAFVGAVGIVAAHGSRLGRVGQAAMAVSLIGAVGTVGTMAVEAAAFPFLAEHAPELLTPTLVDQPTLWVLSVLGILTIAWPIGLALLGAAALRAHEFPRSAGLLLAVTPLLFLALAGPFVPFAGTLSAVAFGAAQAWWGWMIWRAPDRPATAVPTNTAGNPRPGLRSHPEL